MRHVLQVAVTGVGKEGHTHECEYCEDKEVLCKDTFYVRHRDKKIGDVVLCRICAKIDGMTDLFPSLVRMLEMGSNLTDDHGTFSGTATTAGGAY